MHSVRVAEKTYEAKLLVVDDEPNIRELLTTSLRFAGFDVVGPATAPRRWRSPSSTGPTWWCST